MASLATTLRVGIVGCGHAASAHLERLIALDGVVVVGLADPDESASKAFADRLPGVPTFADHRELLRQTSPGALAVFTPHLAHYRIAMDALQADCHVFVETPLSTNLQECVDVAGLARGRGRMVAVGHHYRLSPSLVEARRRLADGAIGSLRLVTATLAEPWLAGQLRQGRESAWRSDPKTTGGGLLADDGNHLLDALLWTTGRAALEVAAIQSRYESAGGDFGPDVVTAALVRLTDGTPATLGLSGLSPDTFIELNLFGDRGRMRVTDQTVELADGEGPPRPLDLPTLSENIDQNFASAVLNNSPLCCPAGEALETVRLLEAIAQSAAAGQLVRLG